MERARHQVMSWMWLTSLILLLHMVNMSAVAGLFFCRYVLATPPVFMATCIVCGRTMSTAAARSGLLIMRTRSAMASLVTLSLTALIFPLHLTGLDYLLLLIQPVYLHALDDPFKDQTASTRTTQCRIAGPASSNHVLDACCHGSSVFFWRGAGIGCVDLGAARHRWEESREEIPCRFSIAITTLLERGGLAGSCELRTVKGAGDMCGLGKRCIV